MLNLPEVTLCCVDTRHPHMALAAMERCLKQAKFGDALLFTCGEHQLSNVPSSIRVIEIASVNSVQDYSHFLMKNLGNFLHTSHLLIVQWDGYVIDPTMWTPAFLEVDYIGAVWPQFTDGHRVGNGGFSLRSKKLLAALAHDEFMAIHPEDTCIARTYRSQLEQRYDIKFASEALAHRFAFERQRGARSSFGFHGLSNLPVVTPLPQIQLFVEQAPLELFAALEARGFIKQLVAMRQIKIARIAMNKRMRSRSLDWSDVRLLMRLYLPLPRRGDC